MLVILVLATTTTGVLPFSLTQPVQGHHGWHVVPLIYTRVGGTTWGSSSIVWDGSKYVADVYCPPVVPSGTAYRWAQAETRWYESWLGVSGYVTNDPLSFDTFNLDMALSGTGNNMYEAQLIVDHADSSMLLIGSGITNAIEAYNLHGTWAHIHGDAYVPETGTQSFVFGDFYRARTVAQCSSYSSPSGAGSTDAPQNYLGANVWVWAT